MNMMIGAAVYLILALAVVVGVRGAFQKRLNYDERAPPALGGALVGASSRRLINTAPRQWRAGIAF